RAHRLEQFELALGEASGLIQETADQGRFPMVDMADNDDADQWPTMCGVGLRKMLGDKDIHDAAPISFWRSKVAGEAKALERILGLMIHRATGALGNPGRFELGDDRVDRARL